MVKKSPFPAAPDDTILAQNIRRLLAARDLSMREASIKAGLGHGAVHDILSSPSKSPRYRTIVALAAALGVAPSQLTDAPLDDLTDGTLDDSAGATTAELAVDDDLFFESVADVLTCILEEGVPIDPAEIAIAALTIYREEATKTTQPNYKAQAGARRERVRAASRTLVKTQKALDAMRARHPAPESTD